MRRTGHFTGVAAAAVALLAFQACDEAPYAPDGDLAASAYGRDGGTVTVPMELEATFTWVVPGATAADCPDLIDPSTGELFTAEGSGYGEATRLGRFEVAKLDHPTINLCSLLETPPEAPTLADVSRSGAFEFVAADGSVLFGSYEFLAVPPDGPVEPFFTFFVEGGTGRFVGAGGRLDALPIPEVSGVPVSDDPLQLAGTIWEPAVFEGQLTLPRPGRGR